MSPQLPPDPPGPLPQIPVAALERSENFWARATWVCFWVQVPFPIYAMLKGGSIILCLLGVAIAFAATRVAFEMGVLIYTRAIVPQIDVYLIKDEYTITHSSTVHTQHFHRPGNPAEAKHVSAYFEARKSGVFGRLLIVLFCIYAWAMFLSNSLEMASRGR